MRKLAAPVAALLAAVTMVATAQAADMSRLPPWLDVVKPQPVVEFLSGWYLRGDIGYRLNSTSSVEAPLAVTSQSYDNAYAVGAGAGYKWQWFRTDVTADYSWKTAIQADTALGPYSANVESTTLLANVYVDFGTWSGFTPYVGVGAGMSRLSVDDLVDPATGSPVVAAHSWRPSWAVMAGTSFQFSPNFVVDVGYRYLSLGDASSGFFPTGGSVTYKDLTAQEIRVGLRFLID